MENDRDIRAPWFKSFDGVISPINALNFPGSRRYSSKFDPYASDSSDSPSPLMKYLRSADATSAASSPTAFISPVKVEEDVIVMDGIPVPKSSKGSGELRTRSPLMPLNSIFGSFGMSNSTSSSSSGSGGRGSGRENIKLHKNRLCRFWEISGLCQFGTECQVKQHNNLLKVFLQLMKQFAHGKEELRPPRFSSKIKPEIFKLNNILEGSSSPSYGSKSSPVSRVKAATTKEAACSLPTKMAFPTSPARLEQPSEITISSNTTPITALPIISDWTPENDGIDVSLPSTENNPSKEDLDAYVEKVLYRANARKRLPVFVEICPEC